MSKFTRFLGGPNCPKICVLGTKFNSKDWAYTEAKFGQPFYIFAQQMEVSEIFSGTNPGQCPPSIARVGNDQTDIAKLKSVNTMKDATETKDLQ